MLFCAIGIASITSSTTSLVQGYFAKSWQLAEGIITDASWVNGGGGDGGPTCDKVTYTYKIREASYTGNRIIFGHICFSTNVMPYAKGQNVHVYYNPKEPSQSVLRVGLLSSYWFFMVTGLAFLLFGVGLIWKEKNLTNHSSGTSNGTP